MPELDEDTLADTLEGITDLREMLAELVRSALDDEALASGLSTRLSDMKTRLERLEARAARKRHVVLEAMTQAELKRLEEADFTASLRRAPRARGHGRGQEFPSPIGSRSQPSSTGKACSRRLKNGMEHRWRDFRRPSNATQREDEVMAFHDKQSRALKAKLNFRHVRTKTSTGPRLSYVEGWYVIAEANRIFGLDAWDRRPVASLIWSGAAGQSSPAIMRAGPRRRPSGSYGDGPRRARHRHGPLAKSRARPRARAQGGGDRCHQTCARDLRQSLWALALRQGLQPSHPAAQAGRCS